MTSFPCASMWTSRSYHARSAISSSPVRSLIANSLESKLYHDRVSCQSKLSFQKLGARKSELHGSSFAVALPFLSKNYGCGVVGRNGRMIITAALPANRGGGHKRLYRKIDFRRNDKDKAGRITTIEYDPNRNANISLVQYGDGEKKYILHPRGAIIGDTVVSGTDVPIKMGNCLPLTEMPLGTAVHNVEITPGRGGQLVRSAGAVAKLIAKEGKNVTLKMPSGEVRLINRNCLATVGQVGNVGVNQKPLGKAGAKRWLGKRPSVRGIAKNPCDHPHGGGEGRAPIGRKGPVTPWGYAALGRRTRKARKYSDNMIVRRRTKA